MPVIIHSREIHPFLPSLGSPLAIDRSRAEQQDIRPLEIAIINLMADKISTERQLALWLGNTMLQVNLTFVATDSYVRGVAAGRHTRNTPPDHIRKFYNAFSDIRHQKFDGFVVTGVNALSPVSNKSPSGRKSPTSCNGRRRTPSPVSSCAGARRRP
jgi:homoserine O-succinyltransferase/O-acetyltransferase